MKTIQSENTTTLPTVVLIGRTNTGKTTLFNRLTGMRSPLVSDIPGTTRDWREATAEWNGVQYRVIDTGGIDRPRVRTRKKGDVATVEEEVQRHAWKQMVNADLILLLVDGKADLSPGDRLWAEQIRKRDLPAIAVVNKVDAPKNREIIQEFWSLGLGTPVAISAVTGMGVGDLLEIVLTKIDRNAVNSTVGLSSKDPEQLTKPIRIAIIGKPNVGKSSLLNAILGEDRAIVSPIAGTTREPIDTRLSVDGQDFVLVDTAGIRRKWKNSERLELAGVSRSKGVLRRTDVALLVLESQDPLSSQDLRLAEVLVESNVGVIIIANKWDLFQESEVRMMGFEVRKEQELAKQFSNYIRDQMPHLAWSPILYVSAKTSRNAEEI
ncbi:MAG: ribosome biogenesis GTPase Der, partial [bacterium]|nr:ribosome biogenesis GTPase Der [bacterium]